MAGGAESGVRRDPVRALGDDICHARIRAKLSVRFTWPAAFGIVMSSPAVLANASQVDLPLTPARSTFSSTAEADKTAAIAGQAVDPEREHRVHLDRNHFCHIGIIPRFSLSAGLWVFGEALASCLLRFPPASGRAPLKSTTVEPISLRGRA
jgi:hypothetical protein